MRMCRLVQSVEQDSVCLSVLVIGEIRAGSSSCGSDQAECERFERRLILAIDLFATG